MKTAVAVLALFLSVEASTLQSKSGSKVATQMKQKALAHLAKDDDRDDDRDDDDTSSEDSDSGSSSGSDSGSDSDS